MAYEVDERFFEELGGIVYEIAGLSIQQMCVLTVLRKNCTKHDQQDFCVELLLY